MTQNTSMRGTLDQIITNASGLYEGNLIPYFQIVFYKAKNVNHPYHNFRHMMHVTYLCHDACQFYANTLNKRQMRTLLIAALFHDFDHRGTLGEDSLNILLAIRGIEKYVLPDDKPYLADIIDLIQATEYPYKTASSDLPLSQQIIRDADLSQSLNSAWIQQVVFGLSVEKQKKPLEILKSQRDFHQSLKFATEWAHTLWPHELIEAKMDEAANLLKILEM